MKWYSLERVWRTSGMKANLRVRFNDWTHQIRWFEIHGESPDGRRFIGKLDNGEKISFSKRSRGWFEYFPSAEFQAHAV